MTDETKQSEESPFSWHRLFGLMLIDYLSTSPFSVELEVDLSHHRQLLDVIVVRRRSGEVAVCMPDGLQDLGDHNLISFKSFHETLDDWTLKELTGHYVNYRKQVSPKGKLLSEDAFRLFAVCSRYPRDLLHDVPHLELQPGVFEIRRGTDQIRVVIAGELPLEERNALIHLFSAVQARVQYGAEHYQPQSKETSTLLYSIIKRHSSKEFAMPYTMQDFRRDFIKYELTPKEREEVVLEALTNSSPQKIASMLSRRGIKVYLEQKGEKKGMKVKSKRRK